MNSALAEAVSRCLEYPHRSHESREAERALNGPGVATFGPTPTVCRWRRLPLGRHPGRRDSLDGDDGDVGLFNLAGRAYDGTGVWVAAYSVGALMKLDSAGAIPQTVTVDARPEHPIFDGSNIWAPCQIGNSVAVVRASSGALLQTLTGNGLGAPLAAAFDGERVLVTNVAGSVSLWKAADLSPLGSVPVGVGTNPLGACSDGLHFWIALGATSRLARF